MPLLSRRRSRESAALQRSLWTDVQAGDALRALGRQAGLPASGGECPSPAPGLTLDELNLWLLAAAGHEGLEAERLFFELANCEQTIAGGAPALVRLQMSGKTGYLAVAGSTHRRVTVIGPDLRARRIGLESVAAAVREPFREAAEADLAPLLDRAGLDQAARSRTLDVLLSDRLAEAHVGGYWLVRPRPQAGLARAAQDAGLLRGLTMLACAHSVQALLFVASWWLLGRGLLQGRLDRGWLLGWVLLLLSLIPFRLAASWTQGLLAVTAGASLRRRLLQGALRIDPQQIRSMGAGRFFGVIAEGGAVEALALSGGLAALLSLLELLIAALVLWASAGWLPVLLLTAWLTAAGAVAFRYLVRRQTWTDRRLLMAERLIEQMIGHRTRLTQQPAAERHRREDDDLERYLDAGAAMDRWELRLLALVPRGWVALAMGAIAPAAVAGVEPGPLAAAIGGMLLSYRALRRLTAGLADLAGAGIAGRLVAPLVLAASRLKAPTPPASAVPPRPGSRSDGIAVHARDLVFRYRAGGEPVLHDCSLRIARGARLLLEGPSGSGKTTFASILAGLATPESGLLLVDGLDRGVLGDAGWRSRVVMAPQPHDNYVLSGSLALNLLIGRQWPPRIQDLQDAETVCRDLGLGDLLERMPGGLHQVVGETGWQLSQGERTRVFLARALLQQPDVLILDESFSALDPENVDRAVRCVLQRAPTVLVIAHT